MWKLVSGDTFGTYSDSHLEIIFMVGWEGLGRILFLEPGANILKGDALLYPFP